MERGDASLQEDDDHTAARDKVEGCQMVAFELLEAAEALAGLASCSAARGGAAQGSGESTRHSQDQPIAAKSSFGYASTTIKSPEKATQRNLENIPSQLCSTSCQSSSVSKFKRKLTEAEKEARKLRRILANRESARQTIRHRQVMYLELTRKAADVSEENQSLKKEKELAMETYNSLKGRNEFLKGQLAKIKKADQPGETQQEPEPSSHAENKPHYSSTSKTTPILVHNQHPSMLPCFWPSMLPSSDLIHFQCASHMSSYQGQDNSSMGGPPRPGMPFFVIPVPWLVPINLSRSSDPHCGTNEGKYHDHQHSTCPCLEVPREEDSRSSRQSVRAEASFPRETMFHGAVINPPFDSCAPNHVERGIEGGTMRATTTKTRQTDANVVSAPENVRYCLSKGSQDTITKSVPTKKAEDVFAATEARRRRKEVMKLRNIHCHDNVQTHHH